MSDDKRWYSWVIRRNRLDNVVGYIKENIPEIDAYFYPLIKKEYGTKKGSTRIKDRPLYEGYLFLRYNDHPAVFHKLSKYPQVTTYCGPVDDEEIEIMEQNQGKLLTELKASRFNQGDRVLFKNGPFTGMEGKIKSISGTVIKVLLLEKLLGFSNHEIVCAEEQLEHKPQLENTEVQNI
jgi:transcription antitermination factor NusG